MCHDCQDRGFSSIILEGPLRGAPISSRFDDAVIEAITSFAGRSYAFDDWNLYVVGSPFFKGAVFVSIIWWYWFRTGDAAAVRRTREYLICTIVGSTFSLVVARSLALLLPFRQRPRFTLHFHFPEGSGPNDLIGWSSFPSDHAVIFAALAVGIGFISRAAGAVAFVYFLLVIAFPRIYLGVHYPTDIIAGAFLGTVVAYAFNTEYFRKLIATSILRREQTTPSFFYAAFFMVCFQLATLFDSFRAVALWGSRYMSRLLS